MKVFVVAALLFSVCFAASLVAKQGSGDSVHPGDQDHSPSGEVKEEHVARYTFEWAVKDDEANLDFGHQETRNGDLTTGLYRVLLPNSVVQTVHYTVDGHSGFVAEVTNEEVQVIEEVKVKEEEDVKEEEVQQEEENESRQ